MAKLLALASIMLLLLGASPGNEKFLKYKAVEAYEIRPGILMMPTYSDDGQVCEIGLEKRHYSPEQVRLDSALSRKEIDQIADELAPASERGLKLAGLEHGEMIVQTGNSISASDEYQNVSIRIYSEILPGSKHGVMNQADVVAVIRWKNRRCK